MIVNFEYAVTVEDDQVNADGTLTEDGKEAALDALIDGVGDTSGGWYPRHTVEPPNEFGDVFRVVLYCIADRHDISPVLVFERAKALLDEDDAWRDALGYAVDQIDDALQRDETWPGAIEALAEEVPSEQ